MVIYHSCKSHVVLICKILWKYGIFPTSNTLLVQFIVLLNHYAIMWWSPQILTVHVTATSNAMQTIAQWTCLHSLTILVFTSCFPCNGDCSNIFLLYFGDSEKLWQRDKQTFFTCCVTWVRTEESEKWRSEARHISGFLQHEYCLKISTWCELARHMHF